MAKKEKSSRSGSIGVGVIILMLLALIGGGIGFGFGGDGAGDGANSDYIEDNQENDGEDKGDNIIKIYVTVSGSDYYYENEKIKFKDLIDEINNIDGDILVEIKDEDASYNAYSKLTDKLDALFIDYQER